MTSHYNQGQDNETTGEQLMESINFTDFIQDWDESLNARYGYNQETLDAIQQGEAEFENYWRFQPGGREGLIDARRYR